jgi:hypothetical protein
MHSLDMLVKSRHRLNNEYNTNVNHAVVWIRKYFFRIRNPEFRFRIQEAN